MGLLEQIRANKGVSALKKVSKDDKPKKKAAPAAEPAPSAGDHFSQLVNALNRRRNAFTAPKTPAASQPKKKGKEEDVGGDNEDEDEEFPAPKAADPSLHFDQAWSEDSD